MSSLETADFYTNDPETLIEIYRKILVSNGILDPISKVTSEDPGLTGEGAGSDRRNVTVEFENPELKPLQLFAKLEVKDNSEHTALTSEMKAFEKESIFLTKYVAEAKQFCNKKGIEETFVTDIYPKCYYGDEKVLIMENLKLAKGYEVFGKDKPHDWDTMSIALKTLARHHAISYAMIEEAGGPENFFERFPVLKFESIDKPVWAARLEPWMQSNMNTNIKLLEISSHLDGSLEAISSLKQLQQQYPTLTELCVTSIQTQQDDLLLLGHGDYWYGNMLFLKDSTTGKIIGEKAIDFQVIRYNSPVVDLTYYLFTSAKTDIRQARLQDLLQCYLTNLDNFSVELGYPINLSLDTLLALYRKRLHFGLIISFMGRYGPGGAIMRSVDMTKVTGDWGEFMSKATKEWVANNMEEAESMAKEICLVMREYRGLVQES